MTLRVLFVCTGNVCRSPAAERLLRRHLDAAAGGFAGLSGVEVSSAGTGALVGEPISPPMAELIAAEGADTGDFAARQLTPSILRAADVVITMTSSHRTQTVSVLPAAVQHTFTLGELAVMLDKVREADIVARSGPSATAAERLGVAVVLAKNHRTLGVDPDEDVVDPYRQSADVYARSFRQIKQGLQPLMRLAAAA